MMNRILHRTVRVGAEPAPVIDPRAYFTLDAHGQRWDLYPQPSDGRWTGFSAYYRHGVLIFREKETDLWDDIERYAKENVPEKPPVEPFLPSVPYKPIPSTPVYGPPSKPPAKPPSGDDIASIVENTFDKYLDGRSPDKPVITPDRSTQSGTVTVVAVTLLAVAGALLVRTAT